MFWWSEYKKKVPSLFSARDSFFLLLILLGQRKISSGPRVKALSAMSLLTKHIYSRMSLKSELRHCRSSPHHFCLRSDRRWCRQIVIRVSDETAGRFPLEEYFSLMGGSHLDFQLSSVINVSSVLECVEVWWCRDYIICPGNSITAQSSFSVLGPQPSVGQHCLSGGQGQVREI